MNYLTLDIETRDDYIGLGLGAGWVYKMREHRLGGDTDKYNVLGIALKLDSGNQGYVTPKRGGISLLKTAITTHDVIIGHNLSYDLGGLCTLGRDIAELIKDKPIIDTYVMAKLYDSSLMNYDLDFLSNKYLNKKKNNQKLVDAILEADIYPWLKKEINEKEKAEKKGKTYTRVLDEKKVLKWAKSNMQLLQEHCYDVVRDYAIQDVVLTRQLFDYFQNNDLYEDITKLTLKYSSVIHITNEMRNTGIRVDLNAARKAVTDIQPLLTSMYSDVYKLAGKEFNINSPKQMQEVFDALGLTYLLTAKGNPSFPSKWMTKQPHEICKLICKIRSYQLVLNTFVLKTLKIQEVILDKTCDEIDKLDYGVIYPQLNILKAKTGRFSSSDPNIQQIPKRDPLLGPICRKMFVPWEGTKWCSADFSNQEGRIHLHLAHLLKCEGTQDFVNSYLSNSSFDTHQKVAELCGIDRSIAKTIYLGKSYGMGGAATCHNLGLPTKYFKPKDKDIEIEVAGDEGKQLINKFNEMMPYLSELSDKCTESLKSKRYIKTLGGRKLRPEVVIENKKFVSLYYRALSLVAQGSGVDQLIDAMIAVYNKGLKMTCVVHDEINMCINSPEEAEILKSSMESAIPLVIPQHVDVGVGDSWDSAK